MSTQPQRREPQYFHPHDRDGYWRSAVRREMEKIQQAKPGIFNQPQTQQEAH